MADYTSRYDAGRLCDDAKPTGAAAGAMSGSGGAVSGISSHRNLSPPPSAFYLLPTLSRLTENRTLRVKWYALKFVLPAVAAASLPSGFTARFCYPGLFRQIHRDAPDLFATAVERATTRKSAPMFSVICC